MLVKKARNYGIAPQGAALRFTSALLDACFPHENAELCSAPARGRAILTLVPVQWDSPYCVVPNPSPLHVALTLLSE